MLISNPRTMTGDGQLIHPCGAILPILKEIPSKRMLVVGTGFYITRYGLFMTASHVLDEFVNENNENIARGFVVHFSGKGDVHFRPIICFHRYKKADIAIGHAHNYSNAVPERPLINLRGILTGKLPTLGSSLVTYAYPENGILDFNHKPNMNTIRGDYFKGKLLRYLPKPENPNMPCGYLETSIEVRSGASGGPVFTADGRIIGVNCRGWNFGRTENGEGSLSYAIPVIEALPIQISNLQLPENSWEKKQIPAEMRDEPLDLALLTKFGHIEFDPPLPFEELES